MYNRSKRLEAMRSPPLQLVANLRPLPSEDNVPTGSSGRISRSGSGGPPAHRWMQRGAFALIDLGFLDGSPRGTRTKPVPKARSLGERFTESGEHRAADCLLLAAEVILEKLVPGDITRIHAGNGVVH